MSDTPTPFGWRELLIMAAVIGLLIAWVRFSDPGQAVRFDAAAAEASR